MSKLDNIIVLVERRLVEEWRRFQLDTLSETVAYGPSLWFAIVSELDKSQTANEQTLEVFTTNGMVEIREQFEDEFKTEAMTSTIRAFAEILKYREGISGVRHSSDIKQYLRSMMDVASCVTQIDKRYFITMPNHMDEDLPMTREPIYKAISLVRSIRSPGSFFGIDDFVDMSFDGTTLTIGENTREKMQHIIDHPSDEESIKLLNSYRSKLPSFPADIWSCIVTAYDHCPIIIPANVDVSRIEKDGKWAIEIGCLMTKYKDMFGYTDQNIAAFKADSTLNGMALALQIVNKAMLAMRSAFFNGRYNREEFFRIYCAQILFSNQHPTFEESDNKSCRLHWFPIHACIWA